MIHIRSQSTVKIRIPCGRKPEYPEKTYDIRYSVDSFHMSPQRESNPRSHAEVKGTCSDDCDTSSRNNSPLFVRNRIFYFAHEIGQRWFRFALCKRNFSATCNATSGTESSCYVKREFNLKLRTCLTFYSADFSSSKIPQKHK